MSFFLFEGYTSRIVWWKFGYVLIMGSGWNSNSTLFLKKYKFFFGKKYNYTVINCDTVITRKNIAKMGIRSEIPQRCICFQPTSKKRMFSFLTDFKKSQRFPIRIFYPQIFFMYIVVNMPILYIYGSMHNNT